MSVHRHENLSFAHAAIDVIPPVHLTENFSLAAQKIIFLHMPKTAGTNVTFLMTALSKLSPDIVKNHRFTVPRVTGVSPNLVLDGWKGGLENASLQLSANPNFCEAFNFISGHFPYGLHEMTPDLESARYIGLVRDPVNREISAANFDYQRGYVSEENILDYALNAGIDNPQTRAYAGQEYMSGECTHQTLERALSNIKEKFLMVAPSGDVNIFMQILARGYGVGAFAIARPQVTGIKILDESMSDLVEKLSERHKFDRMLYKSVSEQWNKWCEDSIIGEGDCPEQMMVIEPDFAKTKQPTLMTHQDIMLHNSQYQAGQLNSIDQDHGKLVLKV